MKELIKNFFMFGFATVIDKIVAFLLIPLFARVFTVPEFGTVELIQSFIAVISIFAYLQLETSLQRYYYTERSKGELIFTLLITVFLLSSFIMFIGILFSKYISLMLLSDTNYQKAIILSMLQIPFTVIITFNSIVLRFEKQNKKFIITVIIRVSLLLIFVLLLIFKHNINGLFVSQLISALVASIISFLYIKKFIVYRFRPNLLIKMLKYAIPQFPARAGSTANAYANRFIVNDMMSIFALGVFSMVLKVSSIINMIHSAFMMAWNQFMFQMIEKNNHKLIFISILSVITPVLFLLVSILTLFSYELIYYVMTPEYIDASKYIGITTLSFSFIIIKEIVDIGPKFQEKTHYLTINFFISVLVNIVSLFIFVPIWGIFGAVFSMFLTNIVLLILSWVVSYRLYPINFKIGEMIINLLPVLFLILLIYINNLSLSSKIFIFLIVLIIYSFSIKKSIHNYMNVIKLFNT